MDEYFAGRIISQNIARNADSGDLLCNEISLHTLSTQKERARAQQIL